MKKSKVYKQYLDLHDKRTHKYIILACLGLLGLLSIVIRKSLIHGQNADYLIFSSWYDFARLHGIHSFKYGYSDGFSNYNPPYTYFLYIATLLPVAKIVAIKGILAFFDIILAVSVYLVVRVFRSQSYIPLIAALTTMFLPTVLLNGVFWGQFDQLYVAFILFSLWAGLTGRSRWAWAFFGIAISIKFQAIFFLPVLGIMVFKKIQWHDIIWGIGAFLVLTLPPVLVGRSLGSLLSIYPDQTKLFNGHLTLNAPNMYQWFPNSSFNAFNTMGICLALAAVLFIVITSLMHQKFSNQQLLLVTTLLLYVIPFVLPAMHERYFFPAGIASLVLAFAYPTRTFISMAVVMQVATVFAYCPFLFGTTPLPLGIVALVVLASIVALWMMYFAPAQVVSKRLA